METPGLGRFVFGTLLIFGILSWIVHGIGVKTTNYLYSAEMPAHPAKIDPCEHYWNEMQTSITELAHGTSLPVYVDPYSRTTMKAAIYLACRERLR